MLLKCGLLCVHWNFSQRERERWKKYNRPCASPQLVSDLSDYIILLVMTSFKNISRLPHLRGDDLWLFLICCGNKPAFCNCQELATGAAWRGARWCVASQYSINDLAQISPIQPRDGWGRGCVGGWGVGSNPPLLTIGQGRIEMINKSSIDLHLLIMSHKDFCPLLLQRNPIYFN